MSYPITAMVADDCVPFAAAMTRLLRKRYTVAPPITALALLGPALQRWRPLVLLLDVMWGQECVLGRLPSIRRAHPDTRICMFSGHSVPRFVATALLGGAIGYLMKPAEAHEVFDAVDAVAGDARYLSPDLQRVVAVSEVDGHLDVAIKLRRVVLLASPEYGVATAWLAFDLGLTIRQAEVALGVHHGLLEKQICRRLERALPTVRKHMRDIYERLKPCGITNHGGLAAAVEQSLQRRPESWRPGGPSPVS